MKSKPSAKKNKQEIKDIADHEEFNNYTSDLQYRVDSFTCRLADEANEKFNRGVKKITAEKYDEAADSVSEMIKKDDLQLELKVNFSYTEPDYDSYIKKYEEEKKVIEDNITQLENSLEGLERSSIKARRIQRDIDRENAKISSIEGRIDELDTQIKPKPVKNREESIVNLYRAGNRSPFSFVDGGLIPSLLDRTLGPKHEKIYKDVWDYSQVKEWESDMNRRKSELNESIDTAKENIKNLKSTLTEDPDYIELQKMKNTKSKNDYEKKLNELKEKHKEEFQKKAAKDLRNARNKIERYLSIDVEKTIKKMMEIKFETKKESLESIIADITETEIKAKCKKEQDKLENLKKQLNDSAEEKQTRLTQIKKNMEMASNLYDKASLLNNQLEERTAVQIETEQLRMD